jgi:hypothetical protein
VVVFPVTVVEPKVTQVLSVSVIRRLYVPAAPTVGVAVVPPDTITPPPAANQRYSIFEPELEADALI